jgi:hypothetical protein
MPQVDDTITVYPLQTEKLSELIQDGPAKLKQCAAGAVVVKLDDGSQYRVNTDGYTIPTGWPYFKENDANSQ